MISSLSTSSTDWSFATLAIASRNRVSMLLLHTGLQAGFQDCHGLNKGVGILLLFYCYIRITVWYSISFDFKSRIELYHTVDYSLNVLWIEFHSITLSIELVRRYHCTSASSEWFSNNISFVTNCHYIFRW